MSISELAFLDPLTIPDTLGGYTSIMKIIAYAVFTGLFIMALLNEQVKGINEEPEYGKVIKRAVLVMCGMALYRLLFMKIVALNQIIGMSLCSMEDYSKFQAMLAAFGTKASSGTFVTMGVNNFFAGMFTLAAILGESIFGIIRYFFLAILYIIGPLAIVSAMLPATAGIMKGWFKKVLQVSFWIVIIRATEAIMLSLRMEQALTGSSSSMDFMIVSGVLVVMIFLTPTLSEAVLSDGNIGAVLGAGMAFATIWSARAAMAAKPLTGGLAGTAAALGGTLLNKTGFNKWTGAHDFGHELAGKLFKPKAKPAQAKPPEKPTR